MKPETGHFRAEVHFIFHKKSSFSLFNYPLSWFRINFFCAQSVIRVVFWDWIRIRIRFNSTKQPKLTQHRMKKCWNLAKMASTPSRNLNNIVMIINLNVFDTRKIFLPFRRLPLTLTWILVSMMRLIPLFWVDFRVDWTPSRAKSCVRYTKWFHCAMYKGSVPCFHLIDAPIFFVQFQVAPDVVEVSECLGVCGAFNKVGHRSQIRKIANDRWRC